MNYGFTQNLIDAMVFAIAGFVLAMFLTPLYTFVAYKYKLLISPSFRPLLPTL